MTQDEQYINTVVVAVSKAGGRALLVGGCVRDMQLGLTPRDYDIEVYGLSVESLIETLEPHFVLDCVGASFGVIKLHHTNLDVSIPRRESKSGRGHKGFNIYGDPFMSVVEASARRDFTINSMAYDCIENKLIDPHGGLEDLQRKILRHTSPQFSEDPLRVLRGMQFTSRFNLRPTPETIHLCGSISPEGLAKERIFEEWKKLILRGVKISLGLKFLRDTRWTIHFPELVNLMGCTQEPDWHPEGDVWEHTLHCMDAFARERVGDPWEDIVVGFAVLCHDFGKPFTWAMKNGRITTYQHEKMGAEPTTQFLRRLTNQDQLVEEVLPLVTNHLMPLRLYASQSKASAIRRLSRKVGRIDRLVRVSKADRAGRPPREVGDFPAGRWLLERARELNVEDAMPKAILMGRHLQKLGLEPGPWYGRILSFAYEAQLDGKFDDEASGQRYLLLLLCEDYSKKDVSQEMWDFRTKLYDEFGQKKIKEAFFRRGEAECG